MNDTNIHKHFAICNRQPTLYALHVSNICISLKMAVVFSRITW